MRQTLPGKEVSLLAMADELVERLARLEEQVRHLANAVETLASRDTELDASLQRISERFNEALIAQADNFRSSLAEMTDRFVSRDDWAFWKNLLTAAVLALLAYGWSALTNIR